MSAAEDPVAREDRPLWVPSEEAIEATNIWHYRRWLAAERGHDFDGYQRSVAVVGRPTSTASGARSGTTSRSPASARRGPVLADREMPGASWFPGASLSYAEHVFRDRPGRPAGDRAAGRERPQADLHLGRAARADRPHRAPACCEARRRPRRPGRRLPAERPRGGRRAAGQRLDRRGLVVLRAGLRRARASSTASRRSSRRCCSRSTATATAAATSTAARSRQLDAGLPSLRATVVPRSARRWRPLARPRRLHLGDVLAGAGRARVRAAPLRPPALGPLLVGDDRAAEGDRPRPRRDPARAPEAAAPPPRPAAGRPVLLVHDAPAG